MLYLLVIVNVSIYYFIIEMYMSKCKNIPFQNAHIAKHGFYTGDQIDRQVLGNNVLQGLCCRENVWGVHFFYY